MPTSTQHLVKCQSVTQPNRTITSPLPGDKAVLVDSKLMPGREIFTSKYLETH